MRRTAAVTTAAMVACATLAVATTAFIKTGPAGRAQTSTGLRAQPAARADSDAEIEQIVRRQVQPMLIAAGGMAVALNLDGRTLFFNYGLADVARKTSITSDSLFNLASVGKVFIATLLAQAVQQGRGSPHDPVAQYRTQPPAGGGHPQG